MEGRRQHLANRRPQLRTQNFGILGTLRREVSRLTPPWFGFRDFAFAASNGREGRDTCRFPVRIGGKIRPKNLRDLAAKRSHSHVHRGISLVDVRPRGAPNGEPNMARKTHNSVEHDQSAETEVEAEIREFVRRDVVTNRERQPENESEMVANSINSVLQGATTTSVQEIDKLITELQALSDRLHSERARVQREVVQYSTLTRAALQSTKIIAESLMQFKEAPDAPALPDLKDQSVAS